MLVVSKQNKADNRLYLAIQNEQTSISSTAGHTLLLQIVSLFFVCLWRNVLWYGVVHRYIHTCTSVVNLFVLSI